MQKETVNREFQYDVFLSHNQADKSRVRRLAERARATCSQQSTSKSQPTSRLERSTGGRGNLPFRDPANAGRRFIPLLPADCKFPEALRGVALLRNRP